MRARLLPIVLGACLLTGCASIRAAVRDIRNDELIGRTAPGLASGAWVGAEPDEVDPVLAGDWYLVAFLLPG